MGASAFLLSACTDLAFVPALFQVARHRRHFALFIGVFQLTAAFMFNLSQALGSGVFLEEIEWHRLSDILTLAYVCCLLVHCMGLENELVNIALRYAAFAFAWIFKLRDAWDSAMWEKLLIAAYVALAAYRAATRPTNDVQYDVDALRFGAAALGVAVFFLVLELSTGGDPFGLLLGCVHISAAATAYFLWKAFPAFDKNKSGGVLLKNATFV